MYLLPQLREWSEHLVDAGLSIIPIDGKRPTLGTWLPCQEHLPDKHLLDIWFGQTKPSRDELAMWFPNGYRQPNGIGVVCGYVSHGHYDSGGTLLIDGDRADLNTSFEERAGNALTDVHIRRTGSGKRHYVFICDEVGRNKPLARYIGSDGKIKAGFETRENHGYFVGIGVHPETKQIYHGLSGDLREIRKISMDQALTLMELARSFDELPKTEFDNSEQHVTQDGHLSTVRLIINEFNRRHPIRDMLLHYKYIQTQQSRFKRPGGKSSSVVIRDDERGIVSIHYSSSDQLYNDTNLRNQPIHDSFDIFRIKEHSGSLDHAIKAAADLLGITLYQQPITPITVQRTTNGSVVIFECANSDVAIACDNEFAAQALFERGCTTFFGPTDHLWSDSICQKIRHYQKRYVWMSERTASVEQIARITRASVVQSLYTADELLYGRGATDFDIAHLLLSAKPLEWRMGLKRALAHHRSST